MVWPQNFQEVEAVFFVEEFVCSVEVALLPFVVALVSLAEVEVASQEEVLVAVALVSWVDERMVKVKEEQVSSWILLPL